jgi:O-acetyl-ADP-ribose deacetylase (regulator of RNase III)
MNYQEIEGDLIKLAKEAKFDVIVHGCNCFSTMGAGIAPQMAKAFGCDKFHKEKLCFKGDINKLGTIDYEVLYKRNKTHLYQQDFKEYIPHEIKNDGYLDEKIIVINAYTQFMYGTNHTDGVSKPLDYEALTLCMRKINHTFKGKHIGMPKIGSGLAGGDWDRIKDIIQAELRDMQVSVIIYKP